MGLLPINGWLRDVVDAMIATSAESATPEQVRRALTSLMPPLADYWSRPLSDYAAFTYQTSAFHSPCAARLFAMERLQDVVRHAALRAGCSHEDAEGAACELRASPVMQTGPHCLLLFEPDAFYTHLFSLMGLQSHGRNWHLAYAGSTMSFNEAAKKGPGWLRVGGEILNVFGLSRSRMDGGSICCSSGPFRFALTNAAGKSAPNAYAARLLAQLPSSTFSTASEAIKTANASLWKASFPRAAKLLQLDDFDVADLIADHLDHSDSLLATALFRDGDADFLLNAIDGLNAGPWRGWIRRSTDFFWHVGRDRIAPLVLDDGWLRSVSSSHVSLEFKPHVLAQALRQHVLLPSLFMSFLVLSILPGVRALGGCRQTVYLPLMRHLAAGWVARSGDRNLLVDLRNDILPSLWGHRVLRRENADPYTEFEQVRDVDGWLSTYGQMPLADASGDLVSFTSDPIWAQMSRSLLAGVVGPDSPEWERSGFGR